ncbi:hypothetical protein VTH06DRAFT_4081 [Thermothelomyces fergusii]
MPVVKGGVWTNIEDEILKASVSKYGLNQWARVSSLLARKTPKQCKARWNEWLDPSIKKIEWSKEEDEKLLHLAKLMPTQWRTIAPIVGRTANQCLERYQRLLDEAEQREASALGLTGPDGGETRAPTADDVRRLRPGEVDPDPETKPARPDTIDLDEDEKEMLSEARARLANTQGKKAKRKARERQQEESRRLAALQKRRELKTAGINIKVTTRKKGQMDYNADIPFEKKPVPGFYDTSEEIARNEYQRAHFDPKKQQVGNKRKGEEEGGDADRKRRKNGEKDGPSASVQAALKAGQMQKLREAEQSSKRKPLVLPAPQVSTGSWRRSDNDATRGLVGNYSTLNTGAPIRTPRAPPQEDHIANEIRNIRALTETQSSLLGGENTPLHQGPGTTGFESAAPRKQVVATPNPLATPLRPAGGAAGATPLRPGQTPLRTPRDTFSLNAQGSEMDLVGGTPADARMRELSLRHQLKQRLAALPKPKETEWELELPEEKAEPATAEQMEEDAAERDRRERELREARELLERKRRTQVMQRDLPRAAEVDYDGLLRAASEMDDPARALVAREAALLMAHDAARYPLPGAPPAAKPVPLPPIDDSALAEARLQILLEMKEQPKTEDVQAVWDRQNANSLLLGLGCYDDEDEDEEDQVAALRSALDAALESLMSSAEKGNKLEKKLGVHLGGYKNRAEMLRKKVAEAHASLEKARNALGAFHILQASEQRAIQSRLAALRAEVAFVSTRERQAQELYRSVKAELDDLRIEVAARQFRFLEACAASDTERAEQIANACANGPAIDSLVILLRLLLALGLDPRLSRHYPLFKLALHDFGRERVDDYVVKGELLAILYPDAVGQTTGSSSSSPSSSSEQAAGPAESGFEFERVQATLGELLGHPLVCAALWSHPSLRFLRRRAWARRPGEAAFAPYDLGSAQPPGPPAAAAAASSSLLQRPPYRIDGPHPVDLGRYFSQRLGIRDRGGVSVAFACEFPAVIAVVMRGVQAFDTIRSFVVDGPHDYRPRADGTLAPRTKARTYRLRAVLNLADSDARLYHQDTSPVVERLDPGRAAAADDDDEEEEPRVPAEAFRPKLRRGEHARGWTFEDSPTRHFLLVYAKYRGEEGRPVEQHRTDFGEYIPALRGNGEQRPPSSPYVRLGQGRPPAE